MAKTYVIILNFIPGAFSKSSACVVNNTSTRGLVMFEFNKRETLDKDDESPSENMTETESGSGRSQSAQRQEQAMHGKGRGEAAVIGPSIHINGDLHGEEDLVIEGEVKGTVHLKNNSLTIGSKGKVTADVYAHSVFVDGYIEGDLYGSEQINIRKTAEMQGNITSPRVSLEDGARFKGSIEMDPEVSQNVFGKNDSAAARNTATTSSFTGKQSAAGGGNNSGAGKNQPASSKPDNAAGNVAVSNESAG